jgi:hypothetical protein
MDWSVRSNIAFCMPLVPPTSPLAEKKNGHIGVDDNIPLYQQRNWCSLTQRDIKMNFVLPYNAFFSSE